MTQALFIRFKLRPNLTEHCIPELFAPVALVEGELGQLGLRHGDHVVDDVLILVVIRDRDSRPRDGTKLTTFCTGSLKLKKFDLETKERELKYCIGLNVLPQNIRLCQLHSCRQ